MTQDEDALPRGVALAWGVAANPQRGPRRELSIERIVEVAVEIADKDGLGAVSMASVANALGFTTMSLYRYVSAKDDLIVLMQEAGTGLPPLSIEQADDWQDGLNRWYLASLEMYALHPWLLDIPITGEPNTPNNLAWLDAGLGVLANTPLDARARVSAVLLLNGQARYEALVTRGASAADSEVGRAEAFAVAQLVTPEQFPFLAPALAAGGFSDDDNPFDFGRARILEGLAQYIASGVQAAPPRIDDFREFARDEGVKKARDRVKDAESKLRDARQKEREAITKARERARRT